MATPLFSYVEPWHWDTSNDGYATAAETQQSYSALINKARTNNFLRKVWNDMVLTVSYWRDITNRSWNTYYGTLANTYMSDDQPILTAAMFNALVVNVGYQKYSWQFEPQLDSYIGRETFRGIRDVTVNYADIAYAAYFIELMQAFNILVGVCNGTIERCELSWAERRSFILNGEAIALPSAPIAYNLLVELDVVSNTELVTIEPFALRINHTDTLALNCTLSYIIAGMARADIEAELWNIIRANAFPSAPFSHSTIINHALSASLAYSNSLSLGSVFGDVGQSSYSAVCVALPAAYFTYSEEIPDIPTIASLLVKPTFAMAVTERLPAAFDFEMTVARSFELELFFEAANIQVLAEAEHGMFKYMAGPLFFVSSFTAPLELSHTSSFTYIGCIAALNVTCTLGLLGAAPMGASVQDTNTFTCTAGRALPEFCESELPIFTQYTAGLDKYSRPTSLEASVSHTMLMFSRTAITSALYAFTEQLIETEMALQASLATFNDYSTLHALNINKLEFTLAISFVPGFALSAIQASSNYAEAAISLLEGVYLEGAVENYNTAQGSMDIEGAGWFYPIRTDNDLYIVQVIKAEQYNTSLLLDALAIYIEATTYQSFVSAANLWATHGIEASLSMLGLFDAYLETENGLNVDENLYLYVQAGLEIVLPWQYPIRRRDDLYIKQAYADNLVGMLYLNANTKHLEATLHSIISLPDTMNAYESLQGTVDISLPYSAFAEVPEGLESHMVDTFNTLATLTASVWYAPVQRHSDLYIKQAIAADIIRDAHYDTLLVGSNAVNAEATTQVVAQQRASIEIFNGYTINFRAALLANAPLSLQAIWQAPKVHHGCIYIRDAVDAQSINNSLEVT